MMTNHGGNVNTIAPLENVTLFHGLVDRVMNRPAHLPGLATFHGPSGYGKTFAATYSANVHRALYVEVGASWTRKRYCQELLKELGIPVSGTIPDMVEKVVEGLALSGAPLIVDEFDHAVERGLVELTREIHDKSGAAMVLIGEEGLPLALVKYERFHNRMLDWVAAQPASAEDVRHLARLYAPEITIADDLVAHINRLSEGRARRACVNIEKVRERAAAEGAGTVDMAWWGNAPLFTGKAPRGRVR